MELIDLSHPITDGDRVYPHLPAAAVRACLTREQSRAHYADGTSFFIGGADLCGNLGTWVDAPFHRFEDGADVADLPLNRLAHVDTVVVRVRGERTVDAEVLDGLEVRERAVLFETGWSERWQTEEYARGGHPFLTTGAAEALRDRGAAFVGTDSLNVDDPRDGARPVHTVLLGAGIPIAENLTNLGALPDGPIRFHAAPVKVRGMASFPVRAYAVVG